MIDMRDAIIRHIQAWVVAALGDRYDLVIEDDLGSCRGLTDDDWQGLAQAVIDGLTDSTDDPAWAAWVQQRRVDTVRPLADSAFVLSIIPRGEPDLKIALETGLAVLLDKPVLAIAQDGATVNDNMRRLARRVVVADLDIINTTGRQRIVDAIDDLMQEINDETDR